MEPQAKYTLVGTALIILVGLIVAATVWLTRNGESAGDRYYKVYFERQSLEGVTTRSEVQMRGIKIGSVTRLLFSPHGQGAVEVIIRVEGSTPVRESTRASVERHLLTGIAGISLVNATEDSPLLSEAPKGEDYPVIGEGESWMEQFPGLAKHLATRADETLERVNRVLSPENEKVFAEILTNMRRLTRDADRTMLAVGGAADDVRKSANGIAADAHTLSARYDALGAQAGTSVQDIAESVRAVQQDVARLTERADRLMASGDVEMQSTAQSLRRAADSVTDVANRLRDPRQIVWGPPAGGMGPGEGAR
jgi:phospholipid/cholesterol/gamma-HCH transport system substrate-binding protein